MPAIDEQDAYFYALENTLTKCKTQFKHINGIVSSGDHITAAICTEKVKTTKGEKGYFETDLADLYVQFDSFMQSFQSIEHFISDGKFLNKVDESLRTIKAGFAAIAAKIKDAEKQDNYKTDVCSIWKNELYDIMTRIKAFQARFSIDDILLVPGNHDIVLSTSKTDLVPPDATPFWESCASFIKDSEYTVNCPKNENKALRETECPVASIHLNTSGVVIFIGFNSTLLDIPIRSRGIGYIGHNQTEKAEEFLELIKAAYPCQPVVAIGVLHHHLAQLQDVQETMNQRNAFKKIHASDEAKSLSLYDTKEFFIRMTNLGIKIFLHGHQHSLLSYDMRYINLDEISSEKIDSKASLAFPPVFNNASCCALGSTDANKNDTYKMAALKIDFERGMVYYSSIAHKTGDDNLKFGKKRCFPIYSLTIPCSERRLYRNTCNWIALSEKIGFNVPSSKEIRNYGLDYTLFLDTSVNNFKQRFNKLWEEEHAVSVCLSDSIKNGNNPPFLVVDNQKDIINKNSQYDLHLLLRKSETTPSSKFQILMNYHTHVEPASMAEWRCFLLPSTKRSPELFFQRLRWNILRLLSNEDNHDNARNLERIANELVSIEKMISQEELSIKTNDAIIRKFFKLSVTTGLPGIYEYRLLQYPDLYSDKKLEVIKEALNEIPTLEEFNTPMMDTQSAPRGLAWIPLERLGETTLERLRNGDIIEWAKEIIYDVNTSNFSPSVVIFQ